MNNPMAISDMTGMAPGKRKTRRGKRNRSPVGSPKDHHANVGKALAAGDMSGAKQHAFALVRALHHVTAVAPPDLGEPDAAEPGAVQSPTAAPNAIPPTTTKAASAMLAAALMKYRKQ